MALKESGAYFYFDLTGACSLHKDPVGRGTCDIDTSSDTQGGGALISPISGHSQNTLSVLLGDGYAPLPIIKVRNVHGTAFFNFDFSASPESIILVAGTATIRFSGIAHHCGSGLAPSVRAAVDAVLRVWGANCKATSGPEVEEALSHVNAALQRIHQAAKRLGFTGEENIMLGNSMAITNHLEMPDTVQSVVECTKVEYVDPDTHVLIGKTTPKILRSLGELAAIRDAWKYTVGGGRLPLGYFVETVLPANPGDGIPPTIRVHFAPPAQIGTGGPNTIHFHFRVIRRAPRFGTCDLYKTLPIPHEYAETFLFPLARYYALSSRRFARKELAEPIIQQAQEVLQLLGDSDPQPKPALTP